jgi:PAS domain-containing protein
MACCLPQPANGQLAGSAVGDEEGEADDMNCAYSKQGFCSQITERSDVSGVSTTHSLEELSMPSFYDRHSIDIDIMASRVVNETSIKEAIRAAVEHGTSWAEAVEDGNFCVSIADPRADDIPLIAVSKKFETITGYFASEVLGKNCRFLNAGCSCDPVNLANLRAACANGTPFTAILENRRKSGELFLNLLDLRGLTVARNPSTGEDLWFLVGIQVDVTHAEMLDVQANLAEIHAITSGIRAGLVEELRALAVAGALRSSFEVSESQLCEASGNSTNVWCLLPTPTWRCEFASVITGDVLCSGAFSRALYGSNWHRQLAITATEETSPLLWTAAEQAKVWQVAGSLGAASLAVEVLQVNKGAFEFRTSLPALVASIVSY